MTVGDTVSFRAQGPGGPAREAIRVRVEVPEARPVVDALFPDYREHGTDTDPPDLVFHRLESGGYAVKGGGRHLGTPTLQEGVGLLEQRLTEELLASLPGIRVLHGSGVAVPGGALLIPGASGAGKSTLAAGLAARGHALFGDDVLVLGLEDRRLHPFERLLKMDCRAVEVLGLEPPPGPLQSFWEDRAFFHPRDLGTEWARPAALAAVALPRRRDEAEAEVAGLPTLTPVSGGEAVKEILEQVLLVERAGGEEFAAVTDALARARLLELRYTRSDRAVALLASELG